MTLGLLCGRADIAETVPAKYPIKIKDLQIYCYRGSIFLIQF